VFAFEEAAREMCTHGLGMLGMGLAIMYVGTLWTGGSHLGCGIELGAGMS